MIDDDASVSEKFIQGDLKNVGSLSNNKDAVRKRLCNHVKMLAKIKLYKNATKPYRIWKTFLKEHKTTEDLHYAKILSKLEIELRDECGNNKFKYDKKLDKVLFRWLKKKKEYNLKDMIEEIITGKIKND